MFQMDLFRVALWTYGIGCLIFQKIEEDKAKQKQEEEKQRIARVKADAEFKHRLKQQEALETEVLVKKETPFKTAIECFKKQYVSYNRISIYASCPHRFKFIYLDREKTIQPSCWSFPFSSKGTVFHEAVEAYLRKYLGQPVPRLDYQEIVNQAFKSQYLKDNRWDWSPERKELEKRKRKNFRDSAKFLCKTLPQNAKIIAIEKDLSFQIGGIKFYGIVDLVLEYPDGHLEIVDYKTGIRLPIKEQLEIYSIPFVNESHCSSISFRVICVDRKSHYRWSQNRSEIVESSNNILGIIKTITDDNTFAPVISSYCQNCPVQHVCNHAKNYKKNGKRVRRSNFLTKLRSKHEWKEKFDVPIHENNDVKNQNKKITKKV